MYPLCPSKAGESPVQVPYSKPEEYTVKQQQKQKQLRYRQTKIKKQTKTHPMANMERAEKVVC